MNPFAIFFLGSLAGSLVTAIAAFISHRCTRDQNLADREADARVIYADGYKDGFAAGQQKAGEA